MRSKQHMLRPLPSDPYILCIRDSHSLREGWASSSQTDHDCCYVPTCHVHHVMRVDGQTAIRFFIWRSHSRLPGPTILFGQDVGPTAPWCRRSRVSCCSACKRPTAASATTTNGVVSEALSSTRLVSTQDKESMTNGLSQGPEAALRPKSELELKARGGETSQRSVFPFGFS